MRDPAMGPDMGGTGTSRNMGGDPAMVIQQTWVVMTRNGTCIQAGGDPAMDPADMGGDPDMAVDPAMGPGPIWPVTLTWDQDRYGR